MEKLVLIDGNSLINRAFYAMPVLMTKKGVPVNAVYGFMNMFFKMLSDVKPKYVAVAFDLKAPTFRHKMYDEYKGTRKPMPDDLRPQIPLLKEVLNVMNIATFEKEGFEADDIIGTIAKHTDVMTYIYTGDKDSFQLVDEQTSVCFTKRGISDIEEYTLENFEDKAGYKPYQVIEMKALMGDSSDNIPGVAGVGQKTALDLITTYKDIDNLYANKEQLKGKLLEKITLGEDMARLSKKLATIDTDCGVDTDLNKMLVPDKFPLLAREKFIELEFKTLALKKELFEDGEIVKNVQDSFQNQESDIDGTNDELGQKNDKGFDQTPIKVKKIDDLTQFSVEDLGEEVSFDISQNSVNLYSDGVEFTFAKRQTLLDDGFELSEILSVLKGLFEGDKKLIVFDKKSLKHMLKNTVEIHLTADCQDLSILKYIADYTAGGQTLDDFIIEYRFEEDSRAYAQFKICSFLHSKLKEDGLESLYYDVELPLFDVLFDMEENGFKVDLQKLSEVRTKYKEILSGLERQIKDLSGEPDININSPFQLGDVLFVKLKLGKGKKIKRGYSTSADILEGLEDAHPIVPLILKYRQLQKLQSTYVEGLGDLVDKSSGLIHTSFNQTVAATGRLSSKEPNLQNIPIREDEGRELRKLFVAKGEDRVLVSADYSQIELRLLAAFSGCKGLIEAFKKGEDVHSSTASKVFGVKPEEVTPQMRRSAKAVNFGIIYGISEYGLAKNLKIPNWQAREYIKAYFEQYPEVKEYMDSNVEFARQNGYAISLLKRKRYIRELKSSNFNVRQFGERVAMNMPLQGSSADIIKVAMVNVAKTLKERGLKSELILQVHDELIIDAFENELQEVRKILEDCMENAVKLAVDLTVEMGSGKTWYETK